MISSPNVSITVIANLRAPLKLQFTKFLKYFIGSSTIDLGPHLCHSNINPSLPQSGSFDQLPGVSQTARSNKALHTTPKRHNRHRHRKYKHISSRVVSFDAIAEDADGESGDFHQSHQSNSNTVSFQSSTTIEQSSSIHLKTLWFHSIDDCTMFLMSSSFIFFISFLILPHIMYRLNTTVKLNPFIKTLAECCTTHINS